MKKFQGNTETEAIMLAKDELGKDAIVTNIKKISPRGIYKLFRKSIVEVTAAVDESNTTTNDINMKLQEKTPRKLNPNIIYENESNFTSRIEDVKKSTDLHGDISAIESKLNNLQSLLEKQLNEKDTMDFVLEDKIADDKNMSYFQLIYNQLIRNEVDEKYVNQIISEVDGNFKNDTTMDIILASIYQKIILKLGLPKSIAIEENKLKFIFFIGPTGVGKTTTIAKIASSLKLGKKAKVALLTSDTYRIAAVEQLRTYANILGIPMKVVYNDDEIKDAKEEFKDFDVVLVDTAGRSHKSIEQRDNLLQIIQSVNEDEREIYLVLSATTKYKDLIRITESYSEIMNYRLIFTKLDETCSVGNIFNIRMLTNAELSYTTSGQNVPDDISKIDTQDIAKQLLGGND